MQNDRKFRVFMFFQNVNSKCKERKCQCFGRKITSISCFMMKDNYSFVCRVIRIGKYKYIDTKPEPENVRVTYEHIEINCPGKSKNVSAKLRGMYC